MTPEELAELKEVVSKAAEAIEGRLAESLNQGIEGLNSKIDSTKAAADEIQSKAKTALEGVPQLIQDQIEVQLKTNLKGIVEDVGNQFEERVKALGGSAGANGGGMSLDKLLANSDKIIGVVNAFRAPTTDQAMMSEMNLIFRWHGLLSKLEKGGGSGEDLTKQIANTFTPKG